MTQLWNEQAFTISHANDATCVGTGTWVLDAQTLREAALCAKFAIVTEEAPV